LSGTAVSVFNVAGEVTAEPGAGSVELADVHSARTEVETGSGGVRIDLVNAPRSLRVDAGSGGVTVSMPAHSSAEVDIQTGSGGITTDFRLPTDRYERNRLRGATAWGASKSRPAPGRGGGSSEPRPAPIHR
jgi:hypothetical protein